MPIRIPNLGPSSSGPVPQGVSISDAVKPALALSNVAQGIGKVGDKLYEHDLKIMEAENAADLTEFKTAAKTAYADRQASFADDHDHLKYKEKWDKDLEGLRKTLSEKGYSQSTLEKANLYLKGFEGDSRIGVASAAQRKAVQRRDQAFKNGVAQIEQFYDPSNPEVGRAMFGDLMADQNLTPEAREAAEMQFDDFSRKRQTFYEVDQDPRAWLESNTEPGRDPALHDAATRRAKHKLAERVKDDWSNVLNGMAVGAVNVEDIEALTPNMDAAGRAKVREFVEDKRDEELQKAVRSPENQAKLTGYLTSQIHDFDSVNDRGTEKELDIWRNLENVQDKSLKKRLVDQYESQLGEVEEAQKDSYGAGLDQLNRHFKQVRGQVRKPEPLVTTRTNLEHLQDGYFNDIPKLKSLGLDDDQISEIRKLPSVDQQAGYLKSIWDERPNQVYADDESLRLAEAITKKDSSLGAVFSKKEASDPEALEAYHRKLNRLDEEKGRVINSYNSWAAQNPAASYDDHLMEVRKIANESREESARRSLMPSQSRATNGKAWRTKLKLSNYGYASDSTPDSYSRNAIGHASNRLRDEQSAAITKSLAVKLGLKRGAVLEIETTQGTRLITYDDTVPSTDKRTGDLPETIDIYRKSGGENSWGGKVTGVRMILQGRDGISGKNYSRFSAENYQKALGLIR